MKRNLSEKAFDCINITILIIISITMLYPFLNILAISLNDAMDTQAGGIYLIPRKFTFESYRVVFKTPSLLNAAFISMLRTIIGTGLTVFCCSVFAYTLTKENFIIYKPMRVFFLAALLLL